MSVPGILIGLVMLTLVMLVIAAPFLAQLRDSTLSPDETIRQRERVLAYYERVVASIRDLDDDHALGKINVDDYERERALWAERGVQALKLLDELNPSAPETAQDDLDADIEAMVARARGIQPASEQILP